MKKFVLLLSVSCLFFLASCKCFMPGSALTEKTPDTITKPTNTIVAKSTDAELSKGTWLKTDSDKKTEVIVQEDILITIKPEETQDPKAKSLVQPQQAILPKNTHVILPENTSIQTIDPTKVKIEASTEVVLPVGTEIAISKVNWYAILFYCLLAFVVGWYYLQGRNEDKDGDGIIDSTEQKPPTNPS